MSLLYSFFIFFILSFVNRYDVFWTKEFILTFRSLKIAGEEIEFSKGFTELHTVSYQKILEGKGYGLLDAKKSIEIVSKIRNKEL